MTKTPSNSNVLLIHFLTCFLLLSITTIQVTCQFNNQEQETLLRLKQEWQNPSILSHWTPLTSASSHCSWPEVTCSSGSVTGLNLTSMNISGTLPPFICSNLNNLTSLALHQNNFTGNFPVSLYNCSKLQYLDLSVNQFVGSIPDDIDRAANLSYLNLCVNNFSGNVPVAIGRLQKLTYLQLQENQFDGTYPEEIGNLLNLEFLSLGHNNFLPSEIPTRFTQLKKVRNFWMPNANLVRQIPDSIGQMEALEVLDFSYNVLTGNIPDGLFKLKNLSALYLYDNNLSGKIPQVVEALNLTVIDLSINNLTGNIPDAFGNLEKLSGLLLFNNQLSGEIPESIARLPALADIRLFTNNLSGPIPQDFGRYSPLFGFQVASNKLSGKLPEYLCQGGVLVGIVVFSNNLSGELPESLGNCNTLKDVFLQDNGFSGSIPGGLWTASNLEKLILSDNQFTGELPVHISSNLGLLNITNNRFSGRIPEGVGSWKSLVIFSASNNQLAGPIPHALTALPRLATLKLDGNQLSGDLPSDIISWSSLNTLNLSRNQLAGQIPVKIGSLLVLGELDLSNNKLSGEIPPQIGSLALRLTFLNLSSNNLTGEIPDKFENSAYNRSFLNNPGLCATSSSTNLTICNSRPQGSRKDSSSLFLSLMLSASAVIFLLAGLLVFFMIKMLRKTKDGLDPTWKITSFQKLKFTESNILLGLTDHNLIGSGGSGKVYRVNANASGDVVAVKKMCSNTKLDAKLEKQFLAEVSTLSTIRHLNIVKLLCCFSNHQTKLLVYEYMENRSLDRWLHTKKKSTSLSNSIRPLVVDWPKRLHIAVGAAQGLSYMHHDCFPPIVHRDVKSSNILLDSEFNAKIADFGLARMLITNGELATVSAIAGSFGYMAPEYANTVKVNEKTDVYSFGVVLLELTTGKEANYGDENTCLAKWAWRHVQEGNPVEDVLDNEVKEACCLDEMISLFRLGLACTSTFPTARPSMKEVVQVLLQHSSPLAYGAKNLGMDYDAAPLLKTSKHVRSDSNVSDAACNV